MYLQRKHVFNNYYKDFNVRAETKGWFYYLLIVSVCAAPWGKRGWKMFSGVLKGMVLYLQKVSNKTHIFISRFQKCACLSCPGLP